MRLVGALITLLCLIPLFDRAQVINFRNYSVEDGLPQTDVLTMQQDKYGNLWVGTAEGIAKYNGRSFKTYTHTDGMAEDYVTSSWKDADGNFILGHVGGGISRYDVEKDSFWIFTAVGEMPHRMITSIYQDDRGYTWFGTLGSGVFRYDGTRLENISKQLSDQVVYGINQDPKGNIWFVTNNGLTVYDVLKEIDDISAYTFVNMESGMPANALRGMVKDKNGSFWIVTGYIPSDDAVYLIRIRTPNSGKQIDYLNLSTNYGTHPGRPMHIDDQGRIWIGTTTGGVYVYEPGYADEDLNDSRLRILNNDNGLKHPAIWSIISDREGNVWLGTQGGGIYQYNGERFVNYYEGDGLTANNVWSILQDHDGNYWFGTSNGLSVLSIERVRDKRLYELELYSNRFNFGNERVTSLLEDKEDNIWIGTISAGIHRFNPQDTSVEVYRHENGSSFVSVRCIAEASNGRIYIGGSQGLFALEPGASAFRTIDSMNVYSLHLDSKGDLWVGIKAQEIKKGLYRFTGDHAVDFKETKGIKTIYCITEDLDGNIWFGTQEEGIYKFDGEKFTNFNQDSGLSSSNVYLIVADNHNHIWVGTSKGLDRLDLNSGKFKHYGKRDGFLGIETNLNAVHKDQTGKIWFGTVDGVIAYDPFEDKPNTVKPITRIVGIKINNKTGSFPADGIFSYQHNNLIFQYEGVSLTDPDRVRYKVKLEPYDADWQITSRVEEKYTNLDAGEYTLMVKASNHEGYWNKEAVIYTFRVLPPFYQTIWFYLLCIVALVGSVYVFIRWRTQNVLAEKRILEGKVQERTVEINRQKEELAIQNKDITDSIHYAKKIQEAILPEKRLIYDAIPNCFILYIPKDIVSGDFYWFGKSDGKVVIAAMDCTVHGVPGAFMSVIGNTLLKEIVTQKGVVEPGTILSDLHEGVRTALRQHSEGSESRDGMDASLCTIDYKNGTLEFSGANNPLYLYRNGKLEEIKGTKHAIGGYQEEEKRIFTNHKVHYKTNDVIYLFSDGFADQFGGDKGKKFMTKRFKGLLAGLKDEDMRKQEGILRRTIEDWRGEIEQLDDILVIGVRF